MRALRSTIAVMCLGCGGAPPASVEPAPTTVTTNADPAPIEGEPASPVGAMAPDPGPRLDVLLATTPEPDPLGPWPAIGGALATCPPPRGASDDAMGEFYEGCLVRSMASWDDREHRWTILDVHASEGGIERIVVLTATADGESEVLATDLSPAALQRLRSVLRRARGRSANLVTEVVLTDFSLGQYAPLVSLGGPLAGMRLYLETIADLDAPEHVLWLLDASGGRTELSRRPAEHTPCDGGGWWCEAAGAEEEECTPQQLRAEGRLCVEPWGIEGVAAAEGTLVVLGTRQVAGHGGYPPFHWVVRLPDAAAP